MVENDKVSMKIKELKELKEFLYSSLPKEEAEKEHIGLKNIHDRLVLIYGDKAGLKIDNKDGLGFVVEIFIPLHEKENKW